MHLLARDLHGLDDAGAAVDLEQTPGKIVFLSFSDSELGLLARVHDEDAASRPSLRCASLAQLKHPFSVDLYLDKVARHARLVVVRLLGGKEYWSYGVEQLAALSRAQGFALAIVPGDGLDDPRLREASTLAPRDCARIWSSSRTAARKTCAPCSASPPALSARPRPGAKVRALRAPAFFFFFLTSRSGLDTGAGIARARSSSRTAARRTCAPCSALPRASSARPRPGAKARASRAPAIAAARRTAGADARRALLVFYRSLFFRTITRQSSRSPTRSPREESRWRRHSSPA